ncbi:unnamed protein product, partial [Rotaria sordida]
YQSLINELMDDQRNLMTGYKTTGPTLAITDETSSSITDSNTTITTVDIKSFNQYEHFYNEINLPSNEDIQKTFKDFKDKQIIYWSDYFPKEKKGYCRIYSYPYTLKYYDDITNHFPGGVFKYVRKVSLFDERPFQHEFFLRIEKSFPLMEELTVCNEKRQINKEFLNH